MLFDLQVAWQIVPRLLNATLVTLGAATLAFAIAITLGLLLAFARFTLPKVLSQSLLLAMETIRMTPLLVQIFIVLYGLPEMGIVLPGYAAGVATIGIHYSVFCAEVYRGGIQTVPYGQWEAAEALGLKRTVIFVLIILPQALRWVLPALGNYAVALLKTTPYLAVVPVRELLHTAQVLGAENYRYVEAFTLVGLLYLVASLGAAALIRWMERKLRY